MFLSHCRWRPKGTVGNKTTHYSRLKELTRCAAETRRRCPPSLRPGGGRGVQKVASTSPARSLELHRNKHAGENIWGEISAHHALYIDKKAKYKTGCLATGDGEAVTPSVNTHFGLPQRWSFTSSGILEVLHDLQATNDLAVLPVLEISSHHLS